MVAFNYDFANTPPSSGGGKNFPVSPEGGWLCQIVGEESRPMKQGQGTMHVFMLQGLEGAVQGMTAESRHNVQHVKPETMQIAMAEISAIAYATGTIQPGNTRLADTTHMFGKPFRVIVAQQANSPYTEIVGYRTADGRDPVKIASGQANGPTHAAAGGPMNGQPPGGFPGGAPAGAPGGFGQPPQQGFGQPPQQQQAPQGQQGWNPQQAGAPQQGQPPANNGAPGWGAPQGQPPQQQGAPGWGAPQGGGAPGWTPQQ